MEEVFDQVLKVINDSEDLNPKIDVSEIKIEMDFKADLGFDSLALMSLVYELQEIYPDLDEMEIAGWQTVLDCTKYISENCKK
jgi:acyl carrier protein